MITKIIVPVLFIFAQLIIAGYGYYTGKLSPQGSFFGFQYDSIIVRSIITQFKYVWILIILNFLFSMGFHLGFGGFRSFLVIAIIWIASGPIAALIFNYFVAKEKFDIPLLVGIILVTLGAIAVVAHKEINLLFSKI